jgi:alginate O-acetyltransferase complex protein AlgI
MSYGLKREDKRDLGRAAQHYSDDLWPANLYCLFFLKGVSPLLFNSLQFLFLFVPCVLLGFWFLFRGSNSRLIFMNLASFVFYGAWSWKFLPLLIFSTYFDFKIAQIMEKKKPEKRKKYVVASVVVNLGLLVFFKYFYFFLDTGSWLLAYLEIELTSPSWDIVLPVGISFYTFQSMSYTIDVYRSHSKPYTDYKLFTAYVCFFPQLVAGPIIRHNELVSQIQETVKKRFSAEAMVLGLHFFTIGLAKKVLIADRIAAGIDPALLQLAHLSSFEALLCALGYSLQLYFDFSGYSDMAIGLGHFFNLKFPVNFDSPYKSQSITEFWRRWHITLSRWLRDYLYIALGGNRLGTFNTYRNLMLTMTLGGLWHGAGWNYVVWGAYHGMWLVIERLLGAAPLWRGPVLLQTLITFLVVTVGLIFFRSPTMSYAMDWFEILFSFEGGFRLDHFHPKVRDKFVVMFLMAIVLQFLPNSQEMVKKQVPGYRSMLYYALIFYLSLVFMASESPFLYFQF